MNPVYVICHEDRAFLCRVCDVSIHEANPQSKKHQRFLFANTRVDLEAMGAGEEAGTRMSPSDSAAEQTVPQYEQEEVGRKVRDSTALSIRDACRHELCRGHFVCAETDGEIHRLIASQRKYQRQQKSAIASEDHLVPSIDELAPGVFESFMTDLLGEEEGRKQLEKSTQDEQNFWGDIFTDSWASMSGSLDDEFAVPDFDHSVPTGVYN